MNLARWTSHTGEDASPVWHPDGGLALFTEIGEGTGEPGPALGWMVDGSQHPEQLLERSGDNELEFPASWSPDGQLLAFTAASGNGDADTYILNRETGTAEPFVATTEFRENVPMFSPGGNWIAYVSNQSGIEDVWITEYPGGDNPTKVSTSGGTEPVWSRDGRELFYRETNRMMAVMFSDGPGDPDTPQQLFADNFGIS